MDQAGAKNMLDSIHRLWVKPELDRRRQSGTPPTLPLRQCLIRLPRGRAPIVQFNDEVGWEARVKTTRPLEEGAPVFVQDIREIESVSPPAVDGQRVAFVYFYFYQRAYHIAFDFDPPP